MVLRSRVQRILLRVHSDLTPKKNNGLGWGEAQKDQGHILIIFTALISQCRNNTTTQERIHSSYPMGNHFFNNVYSFLKARARQSTSRGGAEREGDPESEAGSRL